MKNSNSTDPDPATGLAQHLHDLHSSLSLAVMTCSNTFAWTSFCCTFCKNLSKVRRVSKLTKVQDHFWSNLQGKNSKLLRKDFKDNGIQWSQWLSVTHNPSGIPSHFFCGRKWWGFSKAETVDIPQGKARRLALSRHDDVVNPIVNHAQSYHTWVAKTIKHIFKTIPGLGGYCWVYHIIQVDFTWNMSNMHYLFLREMSLRYLPGNSINPPDKVWISLAETQKVRSPLDKSRQEVH